MNVDFEKDIFKRGNVSIMKTIKYIISKILPRPLWQLHLWCKARRYEKRVLDELNHIRETNHQIDLGIFLVNATQPIVLDQLTYLPGGSGVLDYAFIKEVAKQIRAKVFVEIGSYIGECVNILADICDEVHSVTASEESIYSAKNFAKALNKPDFSNRLMNKKNITTHFVANSQTYDYMDIPPADLYFIDADHSYEGVFADTNNVFRHKKADSVVIWHDISNVSGIEGGGILAIKDCLGSDYENFYIVDNNACGIYVPKQYNDMFRMRRFNYTEESQELWCFNTTIDVIRK